MTVHLSSGVRFQDPLLQAQTTATSLQNINKAARSDQPHIILESHPEPLPLEQLLANPAKFQQHAGAYLTVPQSDGGTLVLSVDMLSRAHLQEALQQAGYHVKAEQAEVLSQTAAPIIAGILHMGNGVAGAVAAAIKKVIPEISPHINGKIDAARLDPVDTKHFEIMQKTIKKVDALIQAGKLSASKRKKAIIHFFLKEASPEYAAASQVKRKAIQHLLMKFELKDLIGAEVQGAGGAATGTGVTGSGKAGHYTNSILTSMTQLLKTDRFKAKVYRALRKLTYNNNLHADLKAYKASLFRSVMQDIAFPDKINQHARGTCAATTIQILLAIKNPAKYVRVVSGLASPQGKFGAQIVREPNTTKDDKSGRSLSGRLVQPAFMEYANAGLDYDNVKDKHSDDHGGLYQHESLRLARFFFPESNYKTTATFAGTPPATKAQVYAAVKKHIDAGTPISVGLRWHDGGHRVLISRIDEANKKVYIVNPWGEKQIMSLDEFKDRLFSATLPGADSTGKNDALTGLPGSLAEGPAYKVLDTNRFRTPIEQLKNDPLLKTTFTAAEQEKIGEMFKDQKLSTSILDYIRGAIKAGMPKNEVMKMVDKYKNLDNPYRTFQTLRMAEALYEAKKRGKVDDTAIKKWVSSYPAFFLDSVDMNKLITALKKDDNTEITRITAAHHGLISENYTQRAFKVGASQEELFKTFLNNYKDAHSTPQATIDLILKYNVHKNLPQADYQKLVLAVMTNDKATLHKYLLEAACKQIKGLTVVQGAHKINEIITDFKGFAKIPQGVVDLLKNYTFAEGLNQPQQKELLTALLTGNLAEAERYIGHAAEQKIKDMSVFQAADMMSSLAGNDMWFAFHKVLDYATENWGNSSDNLAESATDKIRMVMDKAPKQVLHALYAAMDDSWQDSATEEMKILLTAAKNW